MTTFIRTPEFDAWLKALRDPIGKARIVSRIRSAEQGNFGDCEAVGDGVSEMRVHCGPGTGCITPEKEKWSTCCYVVETSRAKAGISGRQKN